MSAADPAPESSPLAAIRDQERALVREIAAAEERARALIAEARARASDLCRRAEEEGLREAAALREEGLERARRRAAEIRAQGEAEAAALAEAACGHIDRAVAHVAQFVLPAGALAPEERGNACSSR